MAGDSRRSNQQSVPNLIDVSAGRKHSGISAGSDFIVSTGFHNEVHECKLARRLRCTLHVVRVQRSIGDHSIKDCCSSGPPQTSGLSLIASIVAWQQSEHLRVQQSHGVGVPLVSSSNCPYTRDHSSLSLRLHCPLTHLLLPYRSSLPIFLPYRLGPTARQGPNWDIPTGSLAVRTRLRLGRSSPDPLMPTA
jgi:hypothetical protein